jgi:hypothetical protein
MTETMQIDTMQIDTYLASLRTHLGPMTLGERDEIVREISAHIRDSAEESGVSVESILARLGSAEELAAQYRDGILIRQASRSISPVLLLRGALRLATKGISGIVVLFLGMVGYLIGGGHGCPATSRTRSIGCLGRLSRFRSSTSEVPVEWGFSRTELG